MTRHAEDLAHAKADRGTLEASPDPHSWRSADQGSDHLPERTRKGAGVTILPPPTDTQYLDAQRCPVCSEMPRETPTVIASGQQRVAQYVCASGHGYSAWWKVGDA